MSIKEWGFANLGNLMDILGGKQGFILERLMGLIGLFSQTVSVGYYNNSLRDTKLVKRRQAFLNKIKKKLSKWRPSQKVQKEERPARKLTEENRSTFPEVLAKNLQDLI